MELRFDHRADQLAALNGLLAQWGETDEALASQSLYSYVIIEQGVSEKLGRWLQKNYAHVPHVVLFEGTPEHHLKAYSPWLIQIPGGMVANGGARQLAIAAQTYPAVSWVWSTLSLAALAEHLRQHMGGILLNEQDGVVEGNVAIRISDPRVLTGLLDTLTSDQKSRLLAPIHTWAVWTRHLHWQVWQGEAQKDIPEGDEFAITLAQVASLDHHTQPDRILSLLEDEYHPKLAENNTVWEQLLSEPQDVRYRTLCTHIQRARTADYQSDQDLSLFVALAYLIHPDFYSFPEMQRELRAAQRQGKSLAVAVAGLPPTVWQEVEARLTMETL